MAEDSTQSSDATRFIRLNALHLKVPATVQKKK